MGITTGAALDVDIQARLEPFEAQMRETDASFARTGASMAAKAEALDRALAEVGKRFGKNVDFSDIERDLAQTQARIDAAFSGGSFETPDLPGVMAELSAAKEAFARLQAQVDPAAAALRTYEAAQEKVARAVELGMVSQREANDVLARAGQAYETAISGLQRYEAVAQTSARASAQVFQEFFAAGDAVAAVERQLDPAAAALRQYETVQAEVARAVELGAVTQTDANRVLAQAGQRYEDVISSLQRVEAANAGSARASAEVFQQFDAAADSVSALERQLDPATAALQQYEAAQRTVARAVEMGAVTQADANRVLGLAGQRYAAQMEALGRGAEVGARGFNRFSGTIQAFGYQVGDTAVQIASGQSAIVAFTQQGAQLAGAFGPWGAVIGAAGAVLGALTVSLGDFGDEAETAEDRTRRLTSAVDAYRSAMEAARTSTADLAGKYGALVAPAREFLDALAQEKGQRALDALNAEVDALTEGLDSLPAATAASLREAGQIIAEMGASADGAAPDITAMLDYLIEIGRVDLKRQVADIEALADRLGVGVPQAAEIAAAFAALSAANGPAEQVRAMSDLLSALQDAGLSVDDMNAAMRTLIERTAEAGVAGAGIVDAAENADDAIEGAARRAEDLRNRLAEAAERAAELSASAASSLIEARIRFENRDDPVKLAGELAGARFDSETDALGEDPATIAARRAAIVEMAEQKARYDEATAAWRKASSSGSTETDQLADAVFNAKARLEEMTAALVDDGVQLGLTGEALVRHKAQAEAAAVAQQLLTRAKREGWKVGKDELDQLDDLKSKYVATAVELDDLRWAHKANEEAAQGLADSFQDAIFDADSFGDAIRNLTLAFAELAAEWIKAGAIKGEGPLAALFGGGDFGAGGGGILGKIGGVALRASIGGYLGGPDLTADPTPGLFGRAMGGGVRAGQPYYVNEHLHGGAQEEIFVPSVNGAVLNVPQAQDALRGAVGGDIATVRLELSGDIDARIVRGAQRVAVQVVRTQEPKTISAAVKAAYASNQEVAFK